MAKAKVKRQRCEICGGKIKVQIFKNSGVCCGRCYKKRLDREKQDG